MKKRTKSILFIAGAIIMAMNILTISGIYAQKKSQGLKIGTYDSRIVTFAWSRSEFFKKRLTLISQQTDSAQKIHDTARVKEISVGAMSYQHLLHQMIFSNGSVGWIMPLVKDKLPELAKSKGVSVIVSKWELNFSDPSVEVVDLTSEVAQLFNPKENIDKMAGDIRKAEPIPMDEMSIENDMLDGYCNRFGKK